MTVEIFSGGVDHYIEPRLQRPVNNRGGEGIIRHADRIMAPGNVRDGLQVGQFQQRVRWRFHPDHARVRANGGLKPGYIVRLNPAHL